jgi:uncharacterized protein (DUF697 family)
MENREAAAIAAICLMAALVDKEKTEAEQQKLKGIFSDIGIEGEAAVFRRVLLRETSLTQEAAELGTPEVRQLAYEMAAAVCDVDAGTNTEEQLFMDELRSALGMPPAARATSSEPQPQEPSAETAAPVTPAKPADSDVDSLVLKYAVLCGALELLPQSLSTMAIIPLQMKLVHGVGEKYGFSLDRGHVKELLAAAGVGVTSQVIEGVARKFLGGLLGKVGGGLAGNIAEGATGAAMSFASTYAVGRIAKAHYSSGRQLSKTSLKELFQKEVSGGKELYSKYAGDIAAKAQTLSPSSVMGLVTGTGAPV